MALSRNMLLWVAAKVAEAQFILADPASTESQRTVARHVLKAWEVR